MYHVCAADRNREQILEDLEDLAEQLEKHKVKVKIASLRQLFYRAGGHLVHAKEVSVEKAGGAPLAR